MTSFKKQGGNLLSAGYEELVMSFFRKDLGTKLKNKLISGTDIFFIIFVIKTSMFKFSLIFRMVFKNIVDWEI
jgi:hypothetical protein